MIYGVAIIAICVLFGQAAGELLGILVGLNTNVGGVGFAMILLILLSNCLKRRGRLDKRMEEGINFCSKMYIPVVIAMTASQNVVQAVSQGIAAILAGITACVAGFLLVPVFSKERKEKNVCDH